MENILTLIPTNDHGRPVSTFLRRTKRLFFDPTGFFREEFPRLEGSSAVVFGLTNAWLSNLASFFVQTLNAILLSSLFDKWIQRIVAAEEGFSTFGLNGKGFVWGAGLVLLTPFLLLLRAFFASSMLYFFTRLLVQDDAPGAEPVSFGSLFRIQSVAFASRWLRVVPVFGGLIAFSVNLILLTVGIRERYAISNRRASAIVLAPYVLLFLLVILLVVIFGLVLSQLPTEELLNFDMEELDL